MMDVMAASVEHRGIKTNIQYSFARGEREKKSHVPVIQPVILSLFFPIQ
jgi:hypothetical protein